jgi:hypothetical protein
LQKGEIITKITNIAKKSSKRLKIKDQATLFAASAMSLLGREDLSREGLSSTPYRP